MYFLPFGKLTNSSIIPQGVRKWAKVDPAPASIPTVSLAPPRIRTSSTSWDEAVTVGSEQIAASVTVTFAIS